ncbi:MAG TPA: RidA family protein [Gaiellales bacterium]|nr:RidA family protein [Gaiellales bacterium]
MSADPDRRRGRRWRPLDAGTAIDAIPYSPAALTDDGTLHISGQIAVDAGGLPLAPDVESQTRHVLGAISALVEAAGGSLGDACFVSTHLARAADFDGFNRVYAECFSPPYPARITTVAGELLAPGVLVESCAVARV